MKSVASPTRRSANFYELLTRSLRHRFARDVARPIDPETTGLFYDSCVVDSSSLRTLPPGAVRCGDFYRGSLVWNSKKVRQIFDSERFDDPDFS